MITAPEQVKTWRDLTEFEWYLERRLACARVGATLRSLPWMPADPTRLTRMISRFPDRRERPVVPFGWSVERCYDRDAWVIGPSWLLAPRRWYRLVRERFYEWAILHRLISLAEGGWYADAVWFPDQPRFR